MVMVIASPWAPGECWFGGFDAAEYSPLCSAQDPIVQREHHKMKSQWSRKKRAEKKSRDRKNERIWKKKYINYEGNWKASSINLQTNTKSTEFVQVSLNDRWKAAKNATAFSIGDPCCRSSYSNALFVFSSTI